MSDMYTFKVIMLGPRGSGKTVFLASMYHCLSIMGKNGFRLQVSDREKQNKLHGYYTQVATDKEWPPGTRGITEWMFTCYVNAENGSEEYPACRFRYLDYDGDRVAGRENSENQAEIENFQDEIKKADLLLVVLDGLKIIDLMRKAPEHIAWVTMDLGNMLTDMQNIKKPVHFVISKWDILDNQFKLEDIRKRLLEIPNFENLVIDKNKKNCPVRLIPMSSVGKGFACPELSPDKVMTMKKFPGKIPEPVNVEMPLAFVPSDVVKSQLEELSKEREFREEVVKIIQVHPDYNWRDRLAFLVGTSVKLLRQAFISNPNTPDIDELLQKGIALLQKKATEKKYEAARKTKKRQEEEAQSIEELKKQELACIQLLKKFGALQESLKSEYPASDLSDVK